MWKTVVPEAAVLAAEAVIRRKINALPAEAFPLRVGPRVQLRRACLLYTSPSPRDCS